MSNGVMSELMGNVSGGWIQAAERAAACTVLVDARKRLPGSGVVFSSNMILTADHVVEREENIRILLGDGSVHVATLGGRDPANDLALLRLEEAVLIPPEAADQEGRVGQPALTVARPGPEGIQVGWALISAIGGPVRTMRGGLLRRFFRLDATPFPGFSGGALVDLNGRLLGINTSGLLAWVSINFTRLSGFGDENVMFLAQMTATPIDMRGLLLGGMIIGALGVLDDLVISQSSAVFELHGANPALSLGFLYRRAMNIGRDHVAATVNTLVLAYAGASLPMLLMFSLNNQNPGLLLNLNFIAEEVVRTMVGSIGLFASVPITTALACLAAVYAHRLGKWRRWLGPETGTEEHSHFH